MDDDALLDAYLAGRAGAFDTLYARYQQRVYRYCFRVLRFNDSDAAECVQEVWLRAIKAAPGYRSTGRFDRWLFTIAHHCLMDRARQAYTDETRDEARSETHGEAGAKNEQACPLSDFVQRFEHCDALETALAQLPAAQRSALLLHYTEGYSLQEIAQLEHDKAETVKSRIRYAMRSLRQWMGAEHA